MTKLAFVTSNTGKLEFLRIVLAPLIDDATLAGIEPISELQLPELQMDSVADICRHKAQPQNVAVTHVVHLVLMS